MSAPATALAPEGVVQIGPKSFRVGTLAASEEAVLADTLSKRLYASIGSYYENAAHALEKAAPQDRLVMVETLTRMDAQRVPPTWSAVEQFRQSPAGAAYELWFRARKYEPDLDPKAVQAVVTEANAVDVYTQLMAAISAKAGAAGKSTA